MISKKELKSILEKLELAYGSKFPVFDNPKVALWYEMFKDCSKEGLLEAVDRCIKESEFPPNVATLTKFYKEVASEHNELIQEVRSKYKSIATVWHENYDADTFNTLLEYVMRFPKETQKTEIQEFAYKAISFMRNCEGCGRQDYPTIKEYIQGKR